ncbi:Cut8 six-helix bundle-domain-containing protein [Dipodascopsis tothii]|uniref:Cut8 six-helix bundle-domain-containing protein n=1 Tax=Dipodascopsis tothii TaxID=44089 RepID=UPI0034D00515
MSAVLPPNPAVLGFAFTSQKDVAPGAHAPSAALKRKHDDDDDDEMTCGSPVSSPPLAQRTLPERRRTAPVAAKKRMRTEVLGRPLPLHRVLDSLDTKALKALVTSLSEKHPFLAQEINAIVPPPAVNGSLALLQRSFEAIPAAFPYKGDHTGDYAYFRVRPFISDFIALLADYTPHFLPPVEQQAGNSLQFLDGVTALVHRLPEWKTAGHNYHKHNTYDELARAWVVALREAGKRAGGVMLLYGGWLDKVQKHNELAGGRLHPAVAAAEDELAGLGAAAPAQAPAPPALGAAVGSPSPRRFGRYF